jgi:hypothetical protein
MPTKRALTSQIFPANKKMHKPVWEHVENSYDRLGTSHKNFLRRKAEDTSIATPAKRGFEKLYRSFDVTTKKTKYLSDRNGKSRGTALPPRVLQERTNQR